jgi:hypothetical protein
MKKVFKKAKLKKINPKYFIFFFNYFHPPLSVVLINHD